MVLVSYSVDVRLSSKPTRQRPVYFPISCGILFCMNLPDFDVIFIVGRRLSVHNFISEKSCVNIIWSLLFDGEISLILIGLD